MIVFFFCCYSLIMTWFCLVHAPRVAGTVEVSRLQWRAQWKRALMSRLLMGKRTTSMAIATTHWPECKARCCSNRPRHLNYKQEETDWHNFVPSVFFRTLQVQSSVFWLSWCPADIRSLTLALRALKWCWTATEITWVWSYMQKTNKRKKASVDSVW